MRRSICILFSILIFNATIAQTNTQTLVEGGRALIELISIFKNTKVGTGGLRPGNTTADSCAVRQHADLCFKNSTSLSLAISLYKRADTGYETRPFSVKVLPKKQECLYELKSGIYKYRIEIDTSAVPVLRNEGEFRLQPCDNMKREIKE